MKQIKYLLLVVFACLSFTMNAQDDIAVYINSANRYASANLHEYKKHLCRQYKVRPNYLEHYFRKCGSDWGNVGVALELAHVTGKHVQDVLENYSKYNRRGWRFILNKMGVCQGAHCYDLFYDHLSGYRQGWDDDSEYDLRRKSHRFRDGYDDERYDDDDEYDDDDDRYDDRYDDDEDDEYDDDRDDDDGYDEDDD